MKEQNSQPTKAVVYTRFSPRPDAKDSMSCAVQRAQCEQFAALRGYEVVRVYDDPDRSGADEYRDKLWSAIEAVPKGGVLLVYRRDRLARNLYLSEAINRAVTKRGGRIVAVYGDMEGETPEAQLVRQIIAAAAEYERKLISARTSAAMRTRMEQGRRVSARPPYGWRVDPSDPKRVVEDEKEQKALQLMRSLYDQGLRAKRIADYLNQNMPEVARTGHWSHIVIHRIIAKF